MNEPSTIIFGIIGVIGVIFFVFNWSITQLTIQAITVFVLFVISCIISTPFDGRPETFLDFSQYALILYFGACILMIVYNSFWSLLFSAGDGIKNTANSVVYKYKQEKERKRQEEQQRQQEGERLREAAFQFFQQEQQRQEEEARLREEEFRFWQEQQRQQEEQRRQQEAYRRQYEQQRRQEEERRRQEQRRESSRSVEDRYHEILGTKPGMSFDEIKKAYHKKVMQYHPDKVSQLGEKLREVAEEEMKKINEAYNYFQQKYQ